MRQVLSVEQVAFKLNRSASWFYVNRRRLESDGFPQPIAILHGYDELAVDMWLDRQNKGGYTNCKSDEREALDYRKAVSLRIARLSQV